MASLFDTVKGNFRNELMSTLQSMSPYSAASMVDMISVDNPKFEDFYNKGTKRDELLMNHSISQGNPYDNAHPMGEFSATGDYHSFMYASVEPDKIKRLQEYRLMASYDFITSALDEICDDFIVVDEDDHIFTFRIDDDDMDKQAKETLEKEFRRIIQHFDLENKGWEYIHNLLIDGEVYFEHIISEDEPDKGVLGVLSVPSDQIDPIFNNVQNMLVKGYLLRKPVYDPETRQVKEIIPVIFDKNQISYFHSHLWNDQKTFRLPHVEKATRAYKQLNMIEDSIVIHRLVNAPEKLVFNVDTGNMSQPQSERYISQLAQKYWSKKTYDSKQGGVNMFNPQSMLDAFWFPKRNGSDGTSIEKLKGESNLGDLPELAFFTNKLYKSLNVPTNRLMPESTRSDGAEMVNEELKFGKFIERLQKQFSETIKQTFITHLKLRGWWKEYNLSNDLIKLKMNPPTHYVMLRQQQIFELESSNYANMAASELISETFCQNLYLKWNDKRILANREHLRKEQGFLWELQNIATYGPDWQNEMQKAGDAGAEDFNGGAGPTGGAMGGDSGLGGDDFGGAPDESVPPDGLGDAAPATAPADTAPQPAVDEV